MLNHQYLESNQLNLFNYGNTERGNKKILKYPFETQNWHKMHRQ